MIATMIVNVLLNYLTQLKFEPIEKFSFGESNYLSILFSQENTAVINNKGSECKSKKSWKKTKICMACIIGLSLIHTV